MKVSNYNKILSKYIVKYQPQLKKIKDFYTANIDNFNSEDLKNVYVNYRTIIKKFITELIDEFKELRKYEFVVLMNGSFSRCTTTLFSDIDINYFYKDNSNISEKINYEFMINYVIEKVLGFRGMDRIHSMIVYLPLISNNSYSYFEENKYPIFFEDGILYFSCRDNSKKLMYELYNSTRNIYDVIEYLNNNDTENKLNEWTNCFELIYDNGLGSAFFRNRKICKSTLNIKYFIEKNLNEFKKDNYYIDVNNDIVMICDMKYYYKGIVLNNIYNMFAVFLRIDKNVIKMNINDFYNSKLFNSDFYDNFYIYLMYLDKLSIKLDKYNLDLSSHCLKEISIRKYGIVNLIKKINKLKKELNNICINIILNLEVNV